MTPPKRGGEERYFNFTATVADVERFLVERGLTLTVGRPKHTRIWYARLVKDGVSAGIGRGERIDQALEEAAKDYEGRQSCPFKCGAPRCGGGCRT